jgi:hypothetical protein
MALLARRRFIPALPGLLPALLALTLCLPELARGQSDDTREYQIKAAFLFNFVQFVKWPSTAFSSSDAPIYIGVLGDDPFGSTLDDTIQGEVVDGHHLSVIRSPRVEEMTQCQVVFVCRSQEGQIANILAQLGSRPILTVSDVSDFADEGGDIDFYMSGDRIRFEINAEAVRQGGLRLSSQLLALGKIVKS